MGFEIDFSSFGEIDSEAWRQISGKLGSQYVRAWLAALDHLAPHYLVARDEKGIAAVVPLYFNAGRQPSLLPFLDPFRTFFSTVSSELESPDQVREEAFRPWISAGVPGTHNAPLLREELSAEHRDELWSLLLERIAAHARELGAKVVSWPCLESDALIDLADRVDGAIPTLHYPDHYLDVPATFEEYLNLWPSSRRANVKKEIKTFEQQGYSLNFRAWPDSIDDFSRLYPNNIAKYEAGGTSWSLGSARELYSAMPREVSVAGAVQRRGRTEAIGVSLEMDRRIFFRTYAAEQTSSASLYPNFIYGLVRRAQEKSYSKVHLSGGSEQAKLSRGARVLPLSLILWPFGDGPWDLVREHLNEQSSARLKIIAALVQRHGRWPEQVEADLGEIAELFL